jgi:antitoxin component YwqK of YwqJK toxin-antitoxin module
MKKIILIIAVLFISTASFAQAKPEMKLNKETNLIAATYYHANGEVSQKGTFNLEKQLHGEWASFNEKGETITVGSYENGTKTGKWLFWANDILKEVEYSNNAIAGVNETKNTEGIVSRN